MQSGKLDIRITVSTYTSVSDGYGGFNNTIASTNTYWCNFVPISGEISQINGKRTLSTEVTITMRKLTADNINLGDTFVLEGQTEIYRINDKFETDLAFYTQLIATKID